MRAQQEAVTQTYFFFQAEDGIRHLTVTGVQTCALPILPSGGPCTMPPTALALGAVVVASPLLVVSLDLAHDAASVATQSATASAKNARRRRGGAGSTAPTPPDDGVFLTKSMVVPPDRPASSIGVNIVNLRLRPTCRAVRSAPMGRWA